jgi:predicted ribosomally synthesized peptide with SipW-like signal peptide
MSNFKKVLATLVVVGAIGAIAAFGTFSAFSSTTSNPGNEFQAGTVTLSDNDSGTALYNNLAAKPGTTVTKCINVTYTGSLDADVKLYVPESIGALGAYTDLTITPGTQTTPSFPSCTGFTPASGGSIFNGTLSAFATAHNAWSNGLGTYPSGATKWTTNNNVVYQITATVDAATPDTAQGATTNSHSLTWQSQSQ